MRQVFETGIITQLTQGSIINNCISEDFCDCKVWGCVVTPRCDLANEGKVSTFHYLPIIDFETWVDKVMRKEMINEHYSNLKGKINQKLENAGIGKNIMEVFHDKEQILKLGAKKFSGKEWNEFSKICNQYFDRDAESEKGYIADEKHYKKYLKDLKSNSIHGIYLIESWDRADCYKIIILRDV